MLFLDFCMWLLFTYVVTQYALPWVFDNELQTNWLFRRKKSTKEKVQSIIEQKDQIDKATKSIIDETESKLKEAQDLKKTVKKL